MKRKLWALCAFYLTTACFAQDQKAKAAEFPSNEEIQLVITQAERAFEQYKGSVVTEATLPTAQKEKSSLDKDRQVVEMAGKLIDALKKKPEAFNGLGGLLLLTTLDDASRNAALCANTGIIDMTQGVLSKLDTSSAYRLLAVAQKCSDVSSLLYTVSESVNALFVRFVEAQGNLNQEATETIDKCMSALKDSASKKQKQ